MDEGGFGTGNKGSDSISDSYGGSAYASTPSFTPSFTPSYSPAPSYYDPAPIMDYSYAQPDFGNLDYLSGGSSGGYTGGISDVSAPSSSGGGFDFNLGGFDDSVFDNSVLPPYASPTSGAAPSFSAPSDDLSAPAFSWDSLNYVAPPGSGAVPQVETLRAVNSDPTTSIEVPGGFSTGGPAGPSAIGGVGSVGGGGGGGGGGDLSARARDDEGFLSKFGIKNPIGTALAAGGLALNMARGQQDSDEVRNLAALAGPAMTTGRQLTEEGRAIGRTGVDDLRTRAAGLDPNSQLLMDRGTGLTGYVGTGTLPPEVQAQVDQARNDAKTARISFYASKGMPTDPTKNTALRTDLERIDRDAIVMGSQLASELAKTGTGIYTAGLSGNQLAGNQQRSAADIGTGFVTAGTAQTGLAADVYNKLATIDQKQTENTQKAIAAMAAALSGKTPSLTIKT